MAFGGKVCNSSGCSCFQGAGDELYVLEKIATNMQLDKHLWTTSGSREASHSPVLLLTVQHELGLPSFDGRGW